MNPWQFLSALGGGVLLGWLFVRTRSLVPCILGHALFNSAAFSTSYLPFQIVGFNTVPNGGSVQFQPVWFDALGLGLTIAGLLLLKRMTPNPSPLELAPVEPPPIPDVAGGS